MGFDCCARVLSLDFQHPTFANCEIRRLPRLLLPLAPLERATGDGLEEREQDIAKSDTGNTDGEGESSLEQCGSSSDAKEGDWMLLVVLLQQYDTVGDQAHDLHQVALLRGGAAAHTKTDRTRVRLGQRYT